MRVKDHLFGGDHLDTGSLHGLVMARTGMHPIGMLSCCKYYNS